MQALSFLSNLYSGLMQMPLLLLLMAPRSPSLRNCRSSLAASAMLLERIYQPSPEWRWRQARKNRNRQHAQAAAAAAAGAAAAAVTDRQ